MLPGLTKHSPEEVRLYLIQHAEKEGVGIASSAADRFGITRQAVSKYLRKLVSEKTLVATGNTRSRSYKLSKAAEWARHYSISPELAEHEVWLQDVAPLLSGLPANVIDIWEFCFTEIFNNAIDHSEGSMISCAIEKNVLATEINISDNGIGIFEKIKNRFNLADERQAILDLSKGKLTTDPSRHTGHEIFFTSRLLDEFTILSGESFFIHRLDEADWMVERPKDYRGTFVAMKLSNQSSRTAKAVFDQYSSLDDDYGFTKTVVPVRLAQFGHEKLISRSQAKMLLARIDRFTTAVLDFEGVNTIGHSFADEIFRVFALAHPGIDLLTLNTVPEVKKMIDSAQARKLADQQERMRYSE